jgi:cell division septation protein DedD
MIGESANIQEALLRHESESDFQSQHLRPSGFTFELCAAEVRKSRADELIARFRPVLQSEGALAETWPQSAGPMVREPGVNLQEVEGYAEQQEFPVHERQKRPKARRLFFSKWTRDAVVAATLVTTAAIIFYFGVPTVRNIQERANAAGGEGPPAVSITEPSASSLTEAQTVASVDTVTGRANQSAEPAPAKSELHDSGLPPNGAMRFAAKTASTEESAGIRPLLEPSNASPTADRTESADLNKRWSVQIAAAPAKDIAGTLVQRLKANGYDGYVVQAAVKGQTYYRVRVGRFATREEAESARASLASQQGYRDAYLTGD